MNFSKRTTIVINFTKMLIIHHLIITNSIKETQIIFLIKTIKPKFKIIKINFLTKIQSLIINLINNECFHKIEIPYF